MRNWGREQRVEPVRDSGMDRESPLPGVIDTIGFGYAALALRPLAIVPIVMLESYLLFGPKVALQPLTTAVSDTLRDRGSGWSGIAGDVERLEGANIFDAGTLEFPLLRTPGIVTAFDAGQAASLRVGGTWSHLPGVVVILILLGSLLTGLVLSSLYRSMLAQAALASREQGYTLQPARILRRTRGIAGWALMLVGLAVLVTMPVLIASVAGALLGFGELTLLWLFLAFPAAWAWVHFFFSIHALILDDIGPLQALRASFQVVQHHFWQSVRFMGVSLLITTGLSFALRELATSLPGALLAILLNAVLASGMIVAAMLFYRDRAIRLGLHAQIPGR